MIRRATTYLALTLFAVVTLIPFAYLVCSAIKPRSVFFSSPFLPAAGLFAIDGSTGELSVVDVSLLPDPATQPEVYEIVVSIEAGFRQPVTRDLRIGYGETGQSDLDFVIPSDAAVNTVLGSVAVPRSAQDVQVRFAIGEGNRTGALGRAWGLLTTDNFDRLFRGVPAEQDADGPRKSTGVARAILNSFFYASVSSVLATLGAAMGGYALAMFRFRGRGLVESVVLGTLVIPGALLIAPGYQVLFWLGLLDSYSGLILPAIAPAFGVYLFRQAMKTGMPYEMMEAARIDGCSEVRMFFTIALPMVRPMTGAFLLITYLGAWNSFIGPQIVLQTPEKLPLAVWISQLRGVYGIDYGLIMAGTLVAIAPVLVLFLILQREFISGLTAGAVKG
ncbi:MAG: hypothetical protein CMJ18_05455 [Phycisphaeraceae bacterium]|nr:hypothetical protein [Phycisphaeraceae bacterium]